MKVVGKANDFSVGGGNPMMNQLARYVCLRHVACEGGGLPRDLPRNSIDAVVATVVVWDG